MQSYHFLCSWAHDLKCALVELRCDKAVWICRSQSDAWREYFFHYSDVKWASWYLKSQATRLFVKRYTQTNKRDNIKARHYWPFVRGIHQWLWISPTNGNYRVKGFYVITSLYMVMEGPITSYVMSEFKCFLSTCFDICTPSWDGSLSPSLHDCHTNKDRWHILMPYLCQSKVLSVK